MSAKGFRLLTLRGNGQGLPKSGHKQPTRRTDAAPAVAEAEDLARARSGPSA